MPKFTSLFASLVLVSAVATVASAQTPPTVRIRGTIEAVDGSLLTIKSRESGQQRPELVVSWRDYNLKVAFLPESGVLPAGYLPDHDVVSGFRVTPVVGFVSSRYQLRIAKAEVHDAFEVPLEYILDAANHKSRRRKLGELTVNVHDIPYGERNIWGATAGMLLTLRRKLIARGGQP